VLFFEPCRIIGIALGFIALLYKLTVFSVTVGANFREKNTATESVLSGCPLYGTSPTRIEAHSFLYLPVMVIPFKLSAPLPGWFPAYVLFTAFKMAFLLWSSVLLLRRIRTHGLAMENCYTVLLPGYILLSVHSSRIYSLGSLMRCWEHSSELDSFNLQIVKIKGPG